MKHKVLTLLLISILLIPNDIFAQIIEKNGTTVEIQEGKPILISQDGEIKAWNGIECSGSVENLKAKNNGTFFINEKKNSIIISTELNIIKIWADGSYTVEDFAGNKIYNERKISETSSSDEEIKTKTEEKKEESVKEEKEEEEIQESQVKGTDLELGSISFKIKDLPEDFQNMEVIVKFKNETEEYEDMILLSKNNEFFYSKNINPGTYSISSVQVIKSQETSFEGENEDYEIVYEGSKIEIHPQQNSQTIIEIQKKDDVKEVEKVLEEIEQDLGKTEKSNKKIIFSIIVLLIIAGAGILFFLYKDKLLYKDQF